MVNNKSLLIVLIIALIATSVFGASFEVRHKTNTTATTANAVSAQFMIYNNSGASVNMNTLTLRYFYTKEGTSAEQFTCDWAQIGNSLVKGTFATGYLEVSFTGGTIANAGNSGEIQTRFNKTDWSNYDQSNDYSFAAVTSYTANSKICLYQNGTLVWGTPSGGTAQPTATATVTGGTAQPGVGLVSVSPATQQASVGGAVAINLLVNSGTQVVAAYGITVAYPTNLLTVNTSIGSSGVEAGAQGFVSAVNAGTAGSLVISGFDTAGKGPGAALDLVKINFTAAAAGTATIGLTISTLTDAAYNNVGTPSGVGGTITITGPTTVRTATRTATIGPTTSGAGRVSVSPATQSTTVGSAVAINLLVNSGTQVVASYGITVTYPSNLLTVNTSIGSSGVEAGAQGYVSAVNAGTAGSLVISGFDTAGKGPGAALDLVKVNFTAAAAGTATISLTVSTLTDAAYNNVGTPTGVGGTITITGPTTVRTATRTATVAPTVTRTATVAPTVTRTATVAPTVTRTATVAPTVTRTATVAPTVTRTATVAPTVTRTATVAPTVTRTATVAPTVTRTATIADVVGKVTILPANLTGSNGSTVTSNVTVNTGSDVLAAYGITIAYPTNLLSITTAGVTAGAQGYVSAVNPNTAGSLVVSGFDTAGKGPATALALLNIAWTAVGTGTGTLTLTVQTLTNATYVNIGTPTGSSGSVTIN